MAQETKNTRVAVLGLGLTGIATVKNLVEIGIDAVGFDKNEYIGGLWQWTTNPEQTSVLKSTKANISKQSSCFQDFPFPDNVPDYPPGDAVLKYIQDYARHFNLHEYFRLGCKVDRVERSPDDASWTIKSVNVNSEHKTELFDKVIVTTGPYTKAFMPLIEGQEHFKGRVLHSQAFKDPADFAGQRVVVVGLAQTGGDTAVSLAGVASQVYMSHRSGARVIPRGTPKPTDHLISRRIASIAQSLNTLIPSPMYALGAFITEKGMQRAPSYSKAWNLLPAPPLYNAPPAVNDHILAHFASGSIIPVRGTFSIAPPTTPSATSSTLVYEDGTKLSNIDAIIFCTGYQSDFAPFIGSSNPVSHTPEWDAHPHANGLLYPRLYQGIFSLAHPDSLAFIGPYRGQSFAAFNNADLISSAVAQIFAGRYALPAQDVMEKWCDANYAASLEQIEKWRITKIGVDPKALERFLNDAAGNGVNEKLAWGWEGWRFWWAERELYGMIVDGINSPFLYRLFEGREGSRKRWDGAKEAIYRVNGKGSKWERKQAEGQKMKD